MFADEYAQVETVRISVVRIVAIFDGLMRAQNAVSQGPRVRSLDDIEKAGDISASIVAGGIKVALLTTVAGLIVAIILNCFTITWFLKSTVWLIQWKMHLSL